MFMLLNKGLDKVCHFTQIRMFQRNFLFQASRVFLNKCRVLDKNLNFQTNFLDNFSKKITFLDKSRTYCDFIQIHNLQTNLEFLDKFRIFRQIQNFQTNLEFLDKFRIFRKIQNFQKNLKFLDKFRIFRHIQNFQTN